MRKFILIFALIPLMAFAQYGQRGSGGGGSTFYWSLTGQAQKTDSLRIIQGTNMTITQSGNTVTFNGAAGAGSTANVRANTGWTSNGTTAQDTLATYYLINGKFQRQMWVDTDNDSVIIAPHSRFPFTYKDGATILSQIDSTGQIIAGDVSGTSIALNPTSANQPQIYFLEATDNANDWFRIYFVGPNNQLIIDGNENDAGNAYTTFNEFVDIGGNGGDPQSNLVLSSSGSGTVEMRATNSTTGASSTDGSVFGIGPSEQLNVWNYENTPSFFGTNNVTRMVISASGGVGIGATTDAQANRAKFNVYSYGDSVLILSASATKSLTDSFLVMLPDGSLKGSGGGNLDFLNVRGNGIQLGSLNLEYNSGISDNGYGGYVRLVSTNGAVNLGSSNSNIIRLTPASQAIIGATATKANQAFLTVNANGTADTTLMVRNDKNSTLDSTMMVFANGSGYFGGNNLYIGGHRIRSNAAGDSLIFYDGNTMIFAILSDGSTADLVAGTPPFKFFGWHRDEIIFWILTIAGLLIWIVAILAIYDKVKEIRIREHKTLPGEI